MATVRPVTKITLDSKNFQDYDEGAKAFLPSMNANVFGQADQLLGKAEKVLQSTVNLFEGFNTNLRKTVQATDLSNPNNPVYAGRFSQSAYINPTDKDNAMRALQSSFNAKISYPSVGNSGFDIKAEDAVLVDVIKNFKNRRAQSRAIEELDLVGGTVDINSVKTKKSPFRSVLSVPMSKTDYDSIINNNTQKEANRILNKYVNDLIPTANRENRIETSIQNEKKREKEAKDKQREEQRKEKEEAESKRKTHGTILKVLAVLTTIADLVRRVVTSALTTSVEAKSEAKTWHDMGYTAEEGRRFKYFDLAHGMDENAHLNAFQALQGAFGLGQELDTARLKKLSYVLTSDTENLAQKGIAKGGETNKLLEMILNDYMSSYLRGENSLGQKESNKSVLRANLVSSLQSAFPEIADLFSTMVEDYESGIYKGQFTNYEGWFNTSKNNTYGRLSDSEQNAFQEMGSLLTSVNAKLKELANTALVSFGLSLAGLVQKVDNIQFGKTATEKSDINKENKDLNVKARAKMLEQKQSASTSFLSEFSDVFGYAFNLTGLTLPDLLSYSNLRADDTSDRANKIRAIMTKIIYGENTDLLAHLSAFGEYSRLYEQANTEASKTSGKVEYNKLDYTDNQIRYMIEQTIKGLIKPNENVSRSQGETNGVYKNLVSRLRDKNNPTLDSLTPDERLALTLGLGNYLDTYGSLESQISAQSTKVDNDFLDEIAKIYNLTASNPVEFKKGALNGNMSAKGQKTFAQAYSYGWITDDMILQAYINLLAGKGNAVTRDKQWQSTMETAFDETQYDYKLKKASEVAFANYVLTDALTKGIINNLMNQAEQQGLGVNRAEVIGSSDERTLNIKLYGVDTSGREKEIGTVEWGTYDSSNNTVVNVPLADLTQ